MKIERDTVPAVQRAEAYTQWSPVGLAISDPPPAQQSPARYSETTASLQSPGCTAPQTTGPLTWDDTLNNFLLRFVILGKS